MSRSKNLELPLKIKMTPFYSCAALLFIGFVHLFD
jgi:hypothetical protein